MQIIVHVRCMSYIPRDWLIVHFRGEMHVHLTAYPFSHDQSAELAGVMGIEESTFSRKERMGWAYLLLSRLFCLTGLAAGWRWAGPSATSPGPSCGSP